ncbi:MAG: DUF4328 domain-containing protein [Leptospiraceae bacterium]|nr:DUF4328 domain-containing protein [Leptospiraceae bacterium]
MVNPYKTSPNYDQTKSAPFTGLTILALVSVLTLVAGIIARLHRLWVVVYLGINYYSYSVSQQSGQLAIEIIQFLPALVSFPCFVVWSYISHRHLRNRFAQSELYQHWLGILGYVIPVVSLFMPYLYIRELYDRYRDVSIDTLFSKPPLVRPAILLWWIFTFLSFTMINIDAFIMESQGSLIPEFDGAQTFFSILSNIAVIYVIYGIEQCRRYALITLEPIKHL